MLGIIKPIGKSKVPIPKCLSPGIKADMNEIEMYVLTSTILTFICYVISIFSFRLQIFLRLR